MIRKVRTLLALVSALATLTSCGADDSEEAVEATDPPADQADTTVASTEGSPTDGPANQADAALEATVERVGSSLRIAWTVTNTGDEDLVVFDNRRPDETGDSERHGAYVVGQEDGMAEIARRLFPVPDDVTGAQLAGVTASELPAGATATGREIVPLPLEHTPAAPRDGGPVLPDDPDRAVFCVGVGPADRFPPSESSSVPAGYRFARHSAANVELQSVLCSEPFAL